MAASPPHTQVRQTDRPSGQVLATLLRQSWRLDPTVLSPSQDEVGRTGSRLVELGIAGLVWRRLPPDLQACPQAQLLKAAFQHQVLQTALYERDLESVVTLFQSAAVEPILMKGWAVSRRYPEGGLRPCGDIDLWVRPDEYARALAELERLEDPETDLDLHQNSWELADRPIEEIVERSQRIRIGKTSVRVLGVEHELRLLCLHFLRHGAWRPLWLCDIALALETRPADFDWDFFARGNPRRTDWAACAIVLAHELLGADMAGVPRGIGGKKLPSWLAPAVLSQWGRPYWRGRSERPIAGYLRRPFELWRGLRQRWANPIEAIVAANGPFNETPPWRFQVLDALAMARAFAARFFRRGSALSDDAARHQPEA